MNNVIASGAALPVARADINYTAVMLASGLRLREYPASSNGQVVSTGRQHHFNRVSADILLFAPQPIAVMDLIELVVARYHGELRPIDVLAYVDCALNEGWLQYAPLACC